MGSEHSSRTARHTCRPVPRERSKPSKFGVLFYLLSIMFCCIGIIIICRFPFIEPSERKWLLLVGLSLICVVLISLLVTNCIVNKENRAFVHYLELKVEQYMAQHQRNIQAIPPDGPVHDI